MGTKIKTQDNRKRQRTTETLVFSGIVVLVGLACFGLGMLSERARMASETGSQASDTVLITSDVALFDARSEPGSSTSSNSGSYFASRNGTSYYPLGCTAGDRILAENKIYFRSVAEAEMAGFKQSASCTFQ